MPGTVKFLLVPFPGPISFRREFVVSGLERKLLAFVVSVAGLSGGGTLLLFQGIAAHRADNVVINLAGAQRMLSQKMTKDAVLLAEGRAEAQTLRESRDRFDRVLSGLIRGDPELGLPASGSPQTQAQLRSVMELWVPFRAGIDGLIQTPQKGAQLEIVVRSNGELLAQMNRAVKLFELEANAKVDHIILLQVALFVALLLLLAVGWSFLLRPLLRQLAAVVDDVGRASSIVCQNAKQLSASSTWLADTAVQQAAALHQTSAAAEAINHTALQCKSSSAAAVDVVSRCEREVEDASRSLTDVVEATAEIGKAAGRIASVNKLIETIAFQTNILALNAAVEAARAGDAGLGFSVVAGEVRGLAQRSADASRETAALVDNTVAAVASGAAKVETASGAMNTVQSDWGQVRILAREINQSSEQQATGVSQITSAVAAMEDNTQKTASVAEENAASALELRAQSETMQTVVTRLARMVDGR